MGNNFLSECSSVTSESIKSSFFVAVMRFSEPGKPTLTGGLATVVLIHCSILVQKASYGKRAEGSAIAQFLDITATYLMTGRASD